MLIQCRDRHSSINTWSPPSFSLINSLSTFLRDEGRHRENISQLHHTMAIWTESDNPQAKASFSFSISIPTGASLLPVSSSAIGRLSGHLVMLRT
mmetsp:Transcript_21270/g.45481  ORF Transcript_21270/g.45481 Transcript_21270/m.45481 type:complete len:95 (-) Transcript_21270:2238-2522(-)